MNLSPLDIVLLGTVLLLAVGFYGLLITRNLIKLVLVLQILVKAAVMALVLAGKSSGNLGGTWAESGRDGDRGRYRCGCRRAGVGGAGPQTRRYARRDQTLVPARLI